MSAIDLPDSKRLLISGLSLLSVLPLFFFRAFVLTCLWSWFAVPLGVVPIGIFHAAGLSILVRFVTWRLGTSYINDDRIVDREEQLMKAWMVPIIVLIMGFIVSFFV